VRRVAAAVGGHPVAWAFVLYATISLCLFGRGAVRHPASDVVGSFGEDQGVFIWSLAWWPHAIETGTNPLLTHLVYAPDGWNLAWTTVIAGPAILAWPITALFGPVVAYNVLALLAPALAALCAYLLCRELEAGEWPAIAGGLVFGFSSYMATETLNHLDLSLVFPIPLAAYLVVRHARRRIGDRAFTIALAATFLFEAATFLETFLTLTGAGLLALGMAFAVAPSAVRRRLVRTTALTGVAYAAALVLFSPYLYVALSDRNPIESVLGKLYPLDLANLFTPTVVTGWHPFGGADVAARMAGNLTEQTGYLGPVAIAAFLVAPVVLWRSRLALATAAFAILVLLASLGGQLHYQGQERGGLPLAWLVDLPLVRHALPARFTVYLWLALAVLVALLVARIPRLAGYALVAGLALSLAPTLEYNRWVTHLVVPPFFEHGQWRAAIRPGDNVLVVPIGFLDNSMLWQQRAGYGFRMAGGYVSATVPYNMWRFPMAKALYGLPLPPDPAGELRRFLNARSVDVIVLRADTPGPWFSLFSTLGAPRTIGGVEVWRIHRPL
jgi:hypothetical protein